MLFFYYIIYTEEKIEKFYMRIDNIEKQSENFHENQELLIYFIYILITKIGNRLGSIIYHILIMENIPPLLALLFDFYYRNKNNTSLKQTTQKYCLAYKIDGMITDEYKHYLLNTKNIHGLPGLQFKLTNIYWQSDYFQHPNVNYLQIGKYNKNSLLVEKNTFVYFVPNDIDFLAFCIPFFKVQINLIIDEIFSSNAILLKIGEHYCNAHEIKTLITQALITVMQHYDNFLIFRNQNHQNDIIKTNMNQKSCKTTFKFLSQPITIDNIIEFHYFHIYYNVDVNAALSSFILSKAMHKTYYSSVLKFTPSLLNMPLYLCFLKHVDSNISQKPNDQKMSLKPTNQSDHYNYTQPEILVYINIYHYKTGIKLGQLICSESLYKNFYLNFFTDNKKHSCKLKSKSYDIFLKINKIIKNTHKIKIKENVECVQLINNVNSLLTKLEYNNCAKIQRIIFQNILNSMILYLI